MSAPPHRSALVLAVALAAGCSDSPYGTLYPVSGVVTLDGKPLPRGNVRFVPDKTKGNPSTHEPVGAVGPDGKYTMMLNGNDGVPPGWYNVTLDATEAIDSTKPYLIPPSIIPKKYNAPNTSGLAVEVVASPAPGAYDLKLTAK